MPEEKKPTINVEIGEKEADGVYSNFVVVGHTQFEFIIDFARMLPGVPKARVHSRVVMTPHHARLLLSAMEENVKKFEERYGKIPQPGQEEQKKGFGF